MDEAGRGALAGPVAVAVVILPSTSRLQRSLSGVRDSKQLSAAQRSRLAPLIQQHALLWGVGASSAEEIDQLRIVAATRLAACRALAAGHLLPDYLLTDFRLELPELDIPQTALVKGDQQSLSIAAASILAKTWRDAHMCELDLNFSQYGLAMHKGYGTLGHRQAILRYGPSPVHRITFALGE
jgi:ribonuclease HII